jgi:hypothetical protein
MFVIHLCVEGLGQMHHHSGAHAVVSHQSYGLYASLQHLSQLGETALSETHNKILQLENQMQMQHMNIRVK